MKNKTYIKLGWLFLIISIVLLGALIFFLVKADYSFENEYKSYWELSDRSSTLQAKEQYMTQFVNLLNENRREFADYNAVFLKTPQNNFDNNLKAITTLRDRLKDIQGMSESSFEYQTAIQQITAQEQGEAINLLSDIQGSYYLKNYPLIWNWILLFPTLLFLFFMITGGIFLYGGYSGSFGDE